MALPASATPCLTRTGPRWGQRVWSSSRLAWTHSVSIADFQDRTEAAKAS